MFIYIICFIIGPEKPHWGMVNQGIYIYIIYLIMAKPTGQERMEKDV